MDRVGSTHAECARDLASPRAPPPPHWFRMGARRRRDVLSRPPTSACRYRRSHCRLVIVASSITSVSRGAETGGQLGHTVPLVAPLFHCDVLCVKHVRSAQGGDTSHRHTLYTSMSGTPTDTDRPFVHNRRAHSNLQHVNTYTSPIHFYLHAVQWGTLKLHWWLLARLRAASRRQW